jgi:hypothetical protein
MVETHFAERKLSDWGRGSFVHWSRKPKGKAIIFIHGFNGGPDDTFSEFEILFRTSSGFKGYDIYFYGYDSLFQPAEVSAVEFRDFIKQIQKNSLSLFNSSLPSDDDARTPYKKVLIVAHSLGAVVSRLALLSAFKKKFKWVDNCSLLLFAPAHKGTSLTLTSIIMGEAMPGLLKIVSLVAKFFVPTIKELQGNSIVIEELEKETKNLIKKGVRTFTIAKGVVWASRERIVRCVTFGEDPEAERIPKTNHSSVCKPSLKFLRPLEILRNHI